MHSLRHLPRAACGAERYEDELRCFSRDEVVSFIDETPLPSPRKSPRRASAASLAPDAYEQHAVALPHFPLTDFEREPQALRRLSEHKRSGGRGGSPEGSPKPDRAAGRRSPGPCGAGKGCRERPRDGRPQGDAGSPGRGPQTAGLSACRGRTGGGKHLSKAESKGSTNSFVSTPSASSSGYITFHSDSVGSTT